MRCAKACSVLMVVGAFSGCGTAEKPAPGREIVTLRVRGGFIEIRAGASGRTYTLLDQDQELIAADLTAEELKARYPDRLDALVRGLAGEGALLDASAPEPESGARKLESFPLDASGGGIGAWDDR